MLNDNNFIKCKGNTDFKILKKFTIEFDHKIIEEVTLIVLSNKVVRLHMIE